MKITDEMLNEFSDIYTKHTGVPIEKTEAMERISTLFMLMKAVVEKVNNY